MPLRPDVVPRVGINGFGRIGRAAFRASLDDPAILVVAINHTAPSLADLLHSIKYDSTHGRCRHAEDLRLADGALYFGSRRIELFSQRDPAQLDWSSAGAEYVIESTGKMLTVESARRHIDLAKARKVVLSAPAKDDAIPTIVVGVNRLAYNPRFNIVSNASCTTNCLAPLAKVLDNAFGIEWGMMTTIHASTSSQPVLDGFNAKNRRLGRGVASNIIPTTTGAAKAVQLVLPHLAGRFTGISIRVPVNNVSMVDLTVSLRTPVNSKEDLLQPLRNASLDKLPNSAGLLSRVIAVNDEQLVSSDFTGWSQSCIVDSAASLLLNPTTAKIVCWYDNEWAYSVRILDLIKYMHAVDHGTAV